MELIYKHGLFQSIIKDRIGLLRSRLISTTPLGLSAEPKSSVSRFSILDVYSQQVNEGHINDDEYQMTIVRNLQKLDDDLKVYQPPSNSIWTKWIGYQNSRPPRGLYLHGSVGCGKTFLMDLFYENCSIAAKVKQRIHFHRFMLNVHSKIHQIKNKNHAKSSQHSFDFNPIPSVARSIASDSWLLCLDEFQVTDVADAMILKQLFKHLFQEGVILVATSNRAPDDLYKSGLQRSSFLPFIDLLKEQCNINCLDSHIDYRKSPALSSKGLYFLTSKDSHNRDLDNFFGLVSLSEKDIVRPRTINVNNRSVHLKKTCGGIIDCDFSELCERPLGADDYDCIGKSFHTVIIRNIPQFNSKLKSEAMRFIKLIDILYDAKTRVVFSADAPLSELFALQSDDSHHTHDENRSLLDDLDLKGSDTKISLLTGEEEIFASDRTVSRITEMQTNQYWESARIYGLLQKESRPAAVPEKSIPNDRHHHHGQLREIALHREM